MSEEPKNPMWVALLSGAVILGTGPLALGALVGLSSRGDEGGFGGLAELVNEGGAFSYAVLFAGALASLVSAMVAAISVRRPGLSAPFALMPFLLPVIAALLGVVFGMKELIMAISRVAPSDKAVILVAATGELSSLSVQALAFAAAGTICVAFAALVSIGAAPRGARFLTLLGAGTLGLCLTVMTAQELAVRGGFRAIAQVAPADRRVVLAGVIQEWQDLNRISNGLFLASLAVAIAGAAVLAARSQRAAGLGTAAALIVAAVGFRGLNSMAERQLAAKTDLPAVTPLMQIEGLEPRNLGTLDLGDETMRRVDDVVLRKASRKYDGHGPWIGLELTSTLQVETALRVLQVAHLATANVELVGHGPKKELVVPPLFVGAVEAMNQMQQAVPVRALFPDEECAGCVTATLTEKGLRVGEREWTLGAQGLAAELDSLPGVELAFPGEVDSLVRAGLTALSNQHVLVVRVPRPVPMPRPPE